MHKSIRNKKKDNAWNIRHLVNELFVPAYYIVDFRIYVPLCVDNAIEVSASYYVQCISTSFQLHKYTCFIKL